MKVKRDQIFPYFKKLEFLLLNERIQFEEKYSWLCNPYETKAR